MSYRVRNILIAIVLAGIAFALTAVYVTNYKRDVKNSQNLVSVLVASRDVKAGTPGSAVAKLLQSTKIERRNVVAGAITSPRQLDGLVASEPVLEGEQVTTRRFQPKSQQGIQGKLSGNLRAFQVPGESEQILAGTLKAGDRVDVVASIKFTVKRVTASGTDTTERVASREILRGLLVLRPAQAEQDSSKLGNTNDQLSVILALTDAQAQKLFFAMKNGDWSLALRPTNDPADSPESVATVESVLGDGLKVNQLQQLVRGFGKGQ